MLEVKLAQQPNMVDSTIATSTYTLERQVLSYYKVCLAGSIGVGKTSIFDRIRTGEFLDLPEASTIGVQQYRTSVQTKGEAVPIEFHDTGGMERVYSCLTSQYFRNAAGLLLVCAVDEQSSLQFLEDILRDAKLSIQDDCFVAIVCNKVDLESEIEEENVESKAEYLSTDIMLCNGIYYISAKTGERFEEMLMDIAQQLKGDRKPPTSNIQPGINDTPSNTKKCPCTIS